MQTDANGCKRICKRGQRGSEMLECMEQSGTLWLQRTVSTTTKDNETGGGHLWGWCGPDRANKMGTGLYSVTTRPL
eukprot:SAG31_NODE_155_length_22130_cov_9.540098_10_plen_76_part_00